jgi:hypothetical protein
VVAALATLTPAESVTAVITGADSDKSVTTVWKAVALVAPEADSTLAL